MTREDAADEYAAAINDRDYTNPVVIQRAKDAKAALEPFMVDGKIPQDIHMRIKEYITNAGSQ